MSLKTITHAALQGCPSLIFRNSLQGSSYCLSHFEGREVVGQLLASPKWTQVTTVGRREVDVPEQYGSADKAKLRQVKRRLVISSILPDWFFPGLLQVISMTLNCLGLAGSRGHGKIRGRGAGGIQGS